MSDDLEQKFSDFLECDIYDQTENAIFTMLRIAFLAGWEAAGGELPQPRKTFYIETRAIEAE